MAKIAIPERFSVPCPRCGVVPFPADLGILHIDTPWNSPTPINTYQMKEHDTIVIYYECCCEFGHRRAAISYVLDDNDQYLWAGYIPYSATHTREFAEDTGE